MPEESNMIELPLDPEFITPDGFYMAGYLWGQHVRSEKDARQMFPGTTQGHEDFYKGVADGHNDKKNEIDERMAKKSKTDPLESPERTELDWMLKNLEELEKASQRHNSNNYNMDDVYNEVIKDFYITKDDLPY